MQVNRFPRRYLAVLSCALIGASLSGCGGGCDDPPGTGSSQSLPSTGYRVVDLGFSNDEIHSATLRVNDAGNATGGFQRADRTRGAFLYTGTTPPTFIGTLGGANSFGLNMNEASNVVGDSTNAGGTSIAFFYNGSMTALDTVASRADGINNATTPLIVGSLLDAQGVLTPVTWQGGVRTALTKLGFARGGATDVNDSGQVVGEVHNSSSDMIAVIWQGGIGVPLGTPIGATNSFARAINNFGQVVGFGGVAGGQTAFLWTPSGANATTGAMGVLQGLGGTSTVAYDISRAGIVVGTSMNSDGQRRAVAWTPVSDNAPISTTPTDLNSLLIPDDRDWIIEFATSINHVNPAWIVGWARSPSGQAQRAVLLVPA